MEKLLNSINWFEIPVINFERAKKFYSAIFEYEMFDTMVGNVHMGFLPYEQVEHRVGGAICQGDDYIPSASGTLPYLNGGSDLNHVLGRVEAAGGKISKPKTFHGEGIGYIAFFIDTEGNRIALHSRH
jgi:uncharacterized protein